MFLSLNVVLMLLFSLASEYYLQESQATPESQLWDCEAQNFAPSCGIKQRLQANKAGKAR